MFYRKKKFQSYFDTLRLHLRLERVVTQSVSSTAADDSLQIDFCQVLNRSVYLDFEVLQWSKICRNFGHTKWDKNNAQQNVCFLFFPSLVFPCCEHIQFRIIFRGTFFPYYYYFFPLFFIFLFFLFFLYLSLLYGLLECAWCACDIQHDGIASNPFPVLRCSRICRRFVTADLVSLGWRNSTDTGCCVLDVHG